MWRVQSLTFLAGMERFRRFWLIVRSVDGSECLKVPYVCCCCWCLVLSLESSNTCPSLAILLWCLPSTMLAFSMLFQPFSMTWSLDTPSPAAKPTCFTCFLFFIFDYERLLISCTCMILCFLSWYPQKCRIVVLCTQLIAHLNIKILISLSTAFPEPALLGPWTHADYCDRSWKVFRTKIDRVITFIYDKVMFKTHMVDIFSTQIYAIKQNKHTTLTWQLQVHHM